MDPRVAAARRSKIFSIPRSPSLKMRRHVRPKSCRTQYGAMSSNCGQAPKQNHPEGTNVTAATTLAGEGTCAADRTLHRALVKNNTKFGTSSRSAWHGTSGLGYAALLGGVAHEAQQECVGGDTQRHHRQHTLPALHGWRRLEPRWLTRYTCCRHIRNSFRKYIRRRVRQPVLSIFIYCGNPTPKPTNRPRLSKT